MRRCSPMVERVWLDRLRPHSEPAPWAGIDLHGVRKPEQLLVKRVVQQAGHDLGCRVLGPDEVGPAHVADEEGVACEGHARLRRDLRVDHQDRHALGRVAGRLQEAQDDLAEADLVAVLDGQVRDQRLRLAAEDDRGARAGRQLAVPAHEVGVQMRLDDVLDAQPLALGLGQVFVHVPPGVHHGGPPVRSHQVGGVSQTAQIELLEIHRPTLAQTGRVGLGGPASDPPDPPLAPLE